MAYDEEVYEKLLKNFELLCTIIQQNTSGNQMKADLTKIEEIINKKIPETLKKNAPEDFGEGYNQMYFDIKGFSSLDDDPTGAFLLTPMWCEDDFAA